MDVHKLQLNRIKLRGAQRTFDMQQKPGSVSSQHLGALEGAYIQLI